MKDFNELLDDLVFRRLEYQSHKYSKEHEEYTKKFEENDKKLRALLPDTEEAKKILDDYIHYESLLDADSMNIAYKRGFKDGMKFNNMLEEEI